MLDFFPLSYSLSNLYESINNQKEDLRKYQKFHMIVKFYLGSPLPPPLTLFYYPILYICRCSGHDITKNKDHFGKGHGGNKTCKENRFREYDLTEWFTTFWRRYYECLIFPIIINIRYLRFYIQYMFASRPTYIFSYVILKT